MADRNTSNISQRLLHLIFILIDICLALDFGYTKYSSKILKYFAKVFHLIHIVIVLYVVFLYSHILYDQYILRIFWYICFNLQYLVCTFVSQLSQEQKSFSSFQNNLILIDRELCVPGTVYNIERKFIYFFVLSLIYELGFLVYYCILTPYCTIPGYYLFLFYCPILGAKILLLVYAFLFYSSYCRMRTLTSLILNRGNACEDACFIYKKLADVTDECRFNFSCMFLWVLTYYVSLTMVSLFYPLLTQLNSVEPVWDFVVANVTVIPTMLMIFAPVYTASLLAAQVQKIKLILYHRLINDRDQGHYATLQKFIRYIEARPFKYCIADILPLDWSLVAIVLNVIITYIIILLQMSPRKYKM